MRRHRLALELGGQGMMGGIYWQKMHYSCKVNNGIKIHDAFPNLKFMVIYFTP